MMKNNFDDFPLSTPVRKHQNRWVTQNLKGSDVHPRGTFGVRQPAPRKLLQLPVSNKLLTLRDLT